MRLEEELRNKENALIKEKTKGFTFIEKRIYFEAYTDALIYAAKINAPHNCYYMWNPIPPLDKK